MKKIALILLLILPFSIFSRKVINSGHQSEVKFITYNQFNNSFFSISKDGTLVIKETDKDTISKRIFLSSYSITSMELSPNSNLMAIVETDNSSLFRVSIWDWSREKRLWSIDLKSFPMSIGFTGNGTYLYITSISDKPVRVYNSRTGQRSSVLNKYNNFVDYIYVGSSEKNGVLYSSTGKLDVVDIKSSKILKSVSTVNNLTDITPTSDKRFLVGHQGDTIYIIGRYNGKVSDKLEVENLESIKLNKTTGELLIYVNGIYKKYLQNLTISGGKFFDHNEKIILLKNKISTYSSSLNTVLYGDSSGRILKHNRWSSENSTFTDNSITNIDDIVIINETGILLSNEILYLFTSPFFSDKVKNPQRLTTYSLTHFDSPIANPKGIKSYNENLLLWNEGIALMNIDSKEVIFEHKTSSEIIDLKIDENLLILLDQNGIVEIIDLETLTIKFRGKSPGFTSVSFYKENEIIGGIDSSLGGSLMIMDITTKETIPVNTSLDIVFSITPGSTSYILYLAGLDGEKTKYIEFNMLTRRERNLASATGEDLDSVYFFDGKKSIFTNLGDSSILKIDTKSYRVKPFRISTNRSDKLYFSNNGLYSINDNRSLSVWHPTTGRKLVDFYLFKDDQWVGIIQNGSRAFGSPGSEVFIGDN